MTKKDKWIKELFGFPTYFLAPIALMVNFENEFLVVFIGIIPFVVAYNLIFEYVFPGFVFNGQWHKGILLVVGQLLFWFLIFRFLI